MVKLQEFILKTLNEENLSSKLEQLKEENIEIEEKPSNILFIEGPWGIGKTYYVKHILEKKLRDSNLNPITVSLFGLKSIEELKNKLVDTYIKDKQSMAKNFFCKILKWPIFLLSLILILYSVLYEPTIICYDLIYSFNTQCYHQIPNYIKVLQYLIFIPKIYSCIFIIYKFLEYCMQTNALVSLVSWLDNKYFGTGVSLQKAEIYELFDAKKNILIFDDIERISDLKIDDLFGFLNNLRENHNFNVITIGWKKRLDDYEETYEKLNFREIKCEYTKRRYEEIKKTYISDSKLDIDFISKKIDYYIAGYLPDSVSDEIAPHVVVKNLRKINIAILSIINIYKELFKNKIFDIKNNDLLDLDNFRDNELILEKSEVEKCVEEYISNIFTGKKTTHYDKFIASMEQNADVKFDIKSFSPFLKTKISILSNIITFKNEEYKRNYLLMLIKLKERLINEKFDIREFIRVNCKDLINNIDEENKKLLKKIIEFFLIKNFNWTSLVIIEQIENSRGIINPLISIFIDFCNSDKGQKELLRIKNSENIYESELYKRVSNDLEGLYKYTDK